MATRLSPRNSEVNALEQRGYLIGKKIGQVVHYVAIINSLPFASVALVLFVSLFSPHFCDDVSFNIFYSGLNWFTRR